MTIPPEKRNGRETASPERQILRFALPLLLYVFCVLCVFYISRAEIGWAADRIAGFEYDVRSMIQMNPDFSTYSDAGGPDGVIWLKRVHYDAAPEGGVERRTMWILLGRPGLPSKWLTWNIPAPENGSVEVAEASLYSFEDGSKVASVVPADGPVIRADFSQSAAEFAGQGSGEFVLVLHYREVFPDKLSIDDLVWTSESLPVWEAVVRVAVPDGQPFYHFSSQSVEPEQEREDGSAVYEWRILNSSAEVSPSLRAASREYVAFGHRDDKRIMTRFMKDAEETPLPPAPQPVLDMLSGQSGRGGKNGDKITGNVLAWLYRQPEIVLTGESQFRKIPAEAPWTAWEKVLLANKWLKQSGIASRLFWRLAYAPEDGKPFSAAVLAAPVLEISSPDPKGDASYYDMTRPPETAGVLSGGVVYGPQVSGENFETRAPRERKAAENNLNVRFDMTLSEDGVMSGTVEIAARNAWKRFLFPEKPSSGDLDALMVNMFTQAPRYSNVTFKESAAESVVTAALTEARTIKGTDGSHIMLPPPPLFPRWIRSLAAGPFPCNLTFPFTMDVRVVIALPPSTQDVFLPPLVQQDAGAIRYSDSYRFDKRKRFLAEAHLTAETVSITDDDAAALLMAIQNWQAFTERYLPVRLRVK